MITLELYWADYHWPLGAWVNEISWKEWNRTASSASDLWCTDLILSVWSCMICTCLPFCDASTFTGHETPTSKQVQRLFGGCDQNIPNYAKMNWRLILSFWTVPIQRLLHRGSMEEQNSTTQLTQLEILYGVTWDLQAALSLDHWWIQDSCHTAVYCAAWRRIQRKRRYLCTGSSWARVLRCRGQGHLHVFQGGRCPNCIDRFTLYNYIYIYIQTIHWFHHFCQICAKLPCIA